MKFEADKVKANQLIGQPEHPPSQLLMSAVQHKTDELSKLQQAHIERAYGLFMTMAMSSKISEEAHQDPEFSKMAMAFCGQLVKTGPNQKSPPPKNPS